MSEIAEDFADYHAWRKEKKLDNKEQSTALLSSYDLKFESRNSGIHLIVTVDKRTADFWPSTGKWIVRDGKTGRGVFNLLRHLNARKRVEEKL